jgi:hypothetical protein
LKCFLRMVSLKWIQNSSVRKTYLWVKHGEATRA